MVRPNKTYTTELKDSKTGRRRPARVTWQNGKRSITWLDHQQTRTNRYRITDHNAIQIPHPPRDPNPDDNLELDKATFVYKAEE